jgi:inorganic pyrophosphatase
MMDLARIPARAGPDGAVHVVVESPRGSALKRKYDLELRAFAVSRPLPLGLSYPYDCGFKPGTKAPDGDPLDALIAWEISSYPRVAIARRIVGALKVEHDRSGGGGRVRNDRVIWVPEGKNISLLGWVGSEAAKGVMEHAIAG